MKATEGKTARMIPFDGVERVHKDDLTAGDGKKHDVLPGKGKLANRTSSNIFEFLRRCGVPVAYIGPATETSFYAFACSMIPLEVVVRGKAYGSKLKRDPQLLEGHVFEKPVVELYLKTKGKRFKELPLPCDDPLLIIDEAGDALLYRPDMPIGRDSFIVGMPLTRCLEPWMVANLEVIAVVAVKTYLCLSQVFTSMSYDYVDFKLEFGATSRNQIVVADDIDSDSGRLMRDGKHLSKQLYREDGSLDDVLAVYTHVAELTDALKHVWSTPERMLGRMDFEFDRSYLSVPSSVS